jgi:hypothetical protein
MDSGRGLSCRICRWPMKKVIVNKVWRSQCRAPGTGPEGARAGRAPPARPGRAAVSQPRAGGSITLHCCHEADGKYRAPGFFHTVLAPAAHISCHDDQTRRPRPTHFSTDGEATSRKAQASTRGPGPPARNVRRKPRIPATTTAASLPPAAAPPPRAQKRAQGEARGCARRVVRPPLSSFEAGATPRRAASVAH